MFDKEVKFFSGDEFKTSESGDYFEVVNPFSGEVAEKVFKAGRNDFSNSLDYLSDAFKKFREEPVYVRAELLKRISEKLFSKQDELARLVTLETGKPLKYSKVEVQRAVLTFAIGAEEAPRIDGELMDMSRIKGSEKGTGLIKRFPVGVIMAITPWNFPVNLAAHKISPALASGNTILLKPASASAGCGIEMMKIIRDACDEMGLSYYPVNALTAPGSITEEFASDNRVALVSFTGSSEVGWKLKKTLRRQKISLELGGNAAVILDESANIDDAIPKIILGAFSQAGQSCISVQRIFVHRKISDQFTEKLIEAISRIKVGNPFDEETEAASMISNDEAVRAESWVSEAVESGAKVLAGGKRNGAVLQPTLLADTSNEMSVNCNEVFAPVATVSEFDDFNDAVDMVNDSRYGLQAGVFTKNLDNAFYAFDKIETGGVIVNHVSTYRMDAMPYGGVKESGNAREGVKYAIEEMTERKLMVIF